MDCLTKFRLNSISCPGADEREEDKTLSLVSCPCKCWKVVGLRATDADCSFEQLCTHTACMRISISHFAQSVLRLLDACGPFLASIASRLTSLLLLSVSPLLVFTSASSASRERRGKTFPNNVRLSLAGGRVHCQCHCFLLFM